MGIISKAGDDTIHILHVDDESDFADMVSAHQSSVKQETA